ncbi:MAG: hypothetical protein KY464_08805 [Gemmatimonadetes bacterium]|nr:hypothetical protein [Gemmatimonadota bacterium]
MPAALRAAVLALLIALPFFAQRPSRPAEVARLGGGDLRALLSAALDTPPGAVVRTETSPPAPVELALLEAVSARAPLGVALPEAPPAVRVIAAPDRARVGRWGAIAFVVRGEPGESLSVTLSAGESVVDSLGVAIGPAGETAAAFRVRPARAGWHEWSVGARGASASAGAWVAAARPPRVLLATGAPEWESRFAARALEEAGVTVVTSQLLGRGLEIGEPFPQTREALRSYDVVVLAAGAPLPPARLALLERYAGEDGGGILVAGASAALPALGIAERSRSARALRGDALQWMLPAEMVALPTAAILSDGQVLEGLRPGAIAGAATADGAPLVALRAHGRGRVAAVGVLESWRWRMEEGRLGQHRDYWSGLVDWLSSGLRDPVIARLPAPEGAVGIPIELTVHAGGATAPSLRLARPGRAAEPLALVGDRSEPGAFRAAFLPVDTGVHLLSSGDSLLAAYRATGSLAPAPEAAANLSLLASRSGGAALPRDSLAAWLAAWRPAEGGGAGDERRLLALVALAALLAAAEWAVRRSRGLR